jgi:hypothetical protein
MCAYGGVLRGHYPAIESWVELACFVIAEHVERDCSFPHRLARYLQGVCGKFHESINLFRFEKIYPPKPHVEKIPEDYLYTLEEIETGLTPDPQQEDLWKQPMRWSDDDDDAIDNELREEPYMWGEHYGNSHTRKKLQDEIDCKKPVPRKPQRRYR